MKRNILVVLLLIVTTLAQAQFTVETHEGDPIVEGQTVFFNVVTYPEASLDFYVFNQGTEPINMKVEFVSAVNTDGSGMEICFGECYTGTIPGTSYPIDDVVVIQPGSSQTSNGDHFYNSDPGNGTDALEYAFRFYMVDAGGNEVGDDLTFNYVYDPLLGVNDVNILEASIFPTVTYSDVNVESKDAVAVSIYDVQGRLIKQTKLEAGTNTLNLSDLRSMIYLVQLTDEAGRKKTIKIVKR
ncbi:MAG: T9SS type A sorting domain-containing protein [Flavobacteriaceae bacterium]|nr:T9SS type A sorting domain-containing protein [Flavobacteriaceae bacterium]